MKNINKELSLKQQEELLNTLKTRFEKNMNRHKDIQWTDVQKRLKSNTDKLWSLNEMEQTGGEPDVVLIKNMKDEIIFFDCSAESPKGRRSLCYDQEALESRKKYKPENSALEKAASMGIEVLNEEQYQELQEFGPFDTKTSSWVHTPAYIRESGGAIFGDFRFGRVFIYHNGAESYFDARGFRGSLRI